MRGQLLVSTTNFDQTAGDYLDIYVNNVINKRLYLTSFNLYSCPISVGDVVRIEVTDVSPLITSYLSLIRRDYTTDDEGANNGITDTTIAIGVPDISYTFTATTVNSAYDFEYRLENTLVPGPTATPTPSPSPSPTPTPSPSPSATPAPTPSPTATPTPSPSASPTPSPTMTGTPTPTPTMTGTPTPTPTLPPNDGQYVIAYGSDYSFSNFGIYVSNDYGATFSYSAALFANKSAISRDGSYMYISAVSSGEEYIYKSTNFGGSWSKIYSITGVTSSSNRTMACSQNGQFVALGNVYSNDYGVSFSTQTSATNAASSDWILPDNSRMYQGGTAGGSTNLLSYRPNLTGSFTTIGTSQRWTQVVASSDNTYILAATDDNPTSPNWIRPTYLSTNSGSTFTAIGGTNSNYGSTVTISDNGQYMLALSGSIAATQDLTLLVSSNNGSTFSSTGLIVSDTGDITPYMSYVIMSSNGQYQFASADYTFGVGNIYRSTNYGSTWNRISQALRIVPLATNRFKI